MRRASVVLLVAWLLVPSAAGASDPDVSPGQTGFFASASESVGPSSNTSASTAATDPAQVITVEQPACLGGSETCGEPVYCDDGTPMVLTWHRSPDGELLDSSSNCPVDEATSQTPVMTPGLVAAAFRRIPLPASQLRVQPPNGRTLVNLETNFFTEQGEFSRSVRLLGRTVELAIWPERFVWRFGDGDVLESESAGAPYPDLEVTHAYRKRGRVTPSVDTTYAARFRVDGGAWREVPRTVTVPGAAESLRVVTARPLLVGG